MKTLITRIKRLALALCFVTPLVSWAAEPVAVWDGDFSAEALNKFSSAGITLVDWQQTHGGINHGTNPASDYSSVTIDRNNQGVFLDFASARGKVTVLVKYSGIPATPSKKSTLIATTANSNGNYNRCGIRLQTDRKVIGLWNNQTASNNDADYGSASSDALPSSGILAFVYDSGTSGITVYAASGTDALGDTALWNNTGLKAGNIYGMAIGGSCRNSNSAATTGMTISGLAVFSSVLSVSDMNAYVWPSEIETIPVTGDTSFSALNAIVAASEAKSVVLSLDDGATVTVDEAFAAASVPVVIASEGSITLSAESQPDASYFTNADFSGVKGGLLRSWLTPGVVGFNFRNNSGGDTSGALATGTWYNDGGNVANGTSTAMFADGLSTLTWASGGTWSSGSGSILSGYLDDGSKNGNGAEVRLSNVPYEEYDVIIYCNSDSNPGYFLAKTVNGTTYTWDSDAGAVVEGSGTWGKAALAIPVYGVNALRIKNLTGPLTIYGTPRSGDSRGGIAAIQIMPPDTPDNIRTYTLTLDGTDTTWSAGTWTLEGNTVDAPTAGNVKIVASASTTVTVDSAVSIATLTVENSTDAVVSLVPGTEGSISTINATVKSGVLKQGAANLVAGTLTVEDGGTFDFGGFASQANVRIAGDGDGNYPWALTSTGDAPLGNWISLVLDADATVGGTGKITFGKNNTAGYINYNGHTLTKTGSGELVLTNGRTVTDGTGTLDIVGGKVTLSQYTCIDGYETIYANTAVIVRNGAELSNGTNRGVWIDTLTVKSGATVTTGDGTYFGVTTALVTEGALTTTKLQFNDDATVTLGGDLTLTDFVAKGDNENTTVGDVALVLADGTASATVTVSGTVDAVGTVSVGSGITPVFSGESDVTATLSYAVDPSPTVSTALAFTQQSNWKGTVVLDYAITGANGGSVFQPGKYGNANSTVCLGQGATNIFLSVRNKSSFGDIDTKLYFKGDVSLRNGWGTEEKATTIPQLGADEGVTFTTRQGAIASNGTTYYTITSLKDFAGTIALSDLTAVTIGNVEMAALPEKGALVVKATTGTGNNKGTISGSVTVGSDTVALVFDTVNDVSGLYRPNTVDITIPTVDNATVAVTVGGVAVTPENGVVTAQVGSAVVVTYTAAEGYKLEGTGTFNFSATDGYSIDVSSTKSSAILARTDDDQTFTRVSDALTYAYMTTGVEVVTVIDSTWSDNGKYDEYFAWDATARTYTKRPYVARIGAVSFTSLAAAIAYEGVVDPIVVLLADVAVANMIDVDKAITLDLAGHTVSVGTWANAQYEDALFCVKYGGSLTVNDSSDQSTGAIDATGNPSKVYAAIKMTRTGETAGDNKVATLVVNGGAISGYYYAVTGHGNRGGTAITINGGSLSGTCEGDNLAIFHPQSGTLTLNGGTLTGVTGVEMRAGTLVVPTASTVAITATGSFSETPNGSGSTVKGAAIALSQHTTNKPLAATIAGGTFTATDTDGKAFYEVDLQDENTDGISATLAGGTFTGAVETENVETLIPATSTALFSESEAGGLAENTYLAYDEVSKLYHVVAVTLDPASLELYPNCSNYVHVVNAPEGSTYRFTFAGDIGSGGYSSTLGWGKPYGNKPGSGTVTAIVSNNNEQVAILVANVTVKDVVAVVDGTEYSTAEWDDAVSAAITGNEILEVYYKVANIYLSEGQTLRWKAADNRGKASATVLAPAATEDAMYKVTSTKENGVTTVVCTNEGAPNVMITKANGTVSYAADLSFSANGVTNKLLRSFAASRKSVAYQNVVLDLNGQTVTFDTAGGNYAGIILGSSVKSGSLTICDTSASGAGRIVDSGLPVWVAFNASSVTIEGGAIVAGEDRNAVYSSTANSTITITGGSFENTGSSAYLINMKDDARGTVTITGGSFKGFNPANNAAEGTGTNFVPDGYVSTETSTGVWTVAEVQEVPVEAGAQTDPVDTAEEAQAIVEKTVVSVPEAVAAKLTEEQQTAYKKLFEATVVPVKVDNATKYAVEVALTTKAKADLQTAVDAEAKDLADAAVAAAADATNGGSATVTTTPGLYYVVEAGADIGSIEPESCTLATGAETTLPVPNKGTSGFYKIRVSVTPVTVTTTVEP